MEIFDMKDNAYHYIPITNCGEIKLSEIFNKPGGMKYTFFYYTL